VDHLDKVSAIIVAAGTGKRMKSTVKKQYMEIHSRPVLFYTLKAFEKSNVDDIVIVTGADETDFVQKEIVDRFKIKKVTKICAGGKERCDSVYEGIKQIAGMSKKSHASKSEIEDGVRSGYVLIHDGVRPLVTPELINFCIENVKKYGACIPGVPEKDTVKEADENMDVAFTPDRKKMFRIQTPQCFNLSLINDACDKYYDEIRKNDETDTVVITDDAMLVEKYTGHKVKIIKGDYRNIKITTPDDLEIAELYLLSQENDY